MKTQALKTLVALAPAMLTTFPVQARHCGPWPCIPHAPEAHEDTPCAVERQERMSGIWLTCPKCGRDDALFFGFCRKFSLEVI
jgi:hypothetical protein